MRKVYGDFLLNDRQPNNQKSEKAGHQPLFTIHEDIDIIPFGDSVRDACIT